MTRNATPAQTEDLRRLMQRLFRRFGALAADTTPCGKPLSMAHAHALMLLLSTGEVTQRDLGAELCIDKSNVARLCAKMSEAGHLIQRPSEQDGRIRNVRLTALGKRVAREVDSASGGRFGALLTELPSRSRDQVLDALQQLVAALDSLTVSPTRSLKGPPK